MDEKTVLNELDDLKERMCNVIDNKKTGIIVRNEQKSKKTGKPSSKFHCGFKALYATRKYGCSGIEDKGECLYCEFRR